MSFETNKAAPSIQQAVNKQRSKKAQDQSEMEGIKISNEGVGDSQEQSTTAGVKTDSTSLSNSQEVEKADKYLDFSRSGQQIVENADSKKKKEESEESSKALDDQINQQIIANWSDLGGAEGVA